MTITRHWGVMTLLRPVVLLSQFMIHSAPSRVQTSSLNSDATLHRHQIKYPEHREEHVPKFVIVKLDQARYVDPRSKWYRSIMLLTRTHRSSSHSKNKTSHCRVTICDRVAAWIVASLIHGVVRELIDSICLQSIPDDTKCHPGFRCL
jgi:hypothetical protein